MPFVHYYPVQCPDCKADLTKPNSVLMLANPREWLTRLEPRPNDPLTGELVDFEELVKHGYHQGSWCRVCGCSLDDHEILPF